VGQKAQFRKRSDPTNGGKPPPRPIGEGVKIPARQGLAKRQAPFGPHSQTNLADCVKKNGELGKRESKKLRPVRANKSIGILVPRTKGFTLENPITKRVWGGIIIGKRGGCGGARSQTKKRKKPRLRI